ncbi:uncharacterized protein LOC129741717 [Uranotaenia lowii]|uniref:uncharacterized protein LOC129741717 n=1 Tax=Uranotaenia lowii TaxID=190385 RepID=UPI00247A492F|nr:uncharacterized protein LOC129741717 [Uranotaenia lowii]
MRPKEHTHTEAPADEEDLCRCCSTVEEFAAAAAKSSSVGSMWYPIRVPCSDRIAGFRAQPIVPNIGGKTQALSGDGETFSSTSSWQRSCRRPTVPGIGKSTPTLAAREIDVGLDVLLHDPGRIPQETSIMVYLRRCRSTDIFRDRLVETQNFLGNHASRSKKKNSGRTRTWISGFPVRFSSIMAAKTN